MSNFKSKIQEILKLKEKEIYAPIERIKRRLSRSFFINNIDNVVNTSSISKYLDKSLSSHCHKISNQSLTKSKSQKLLKCLKLDTSNIVDEEDFIIKIKQNVKIFS
jgi:hypothetical protein